MPFYICLLLLPSLGHACTLLPRTSGHDVGVAQCPVDMAAEVHDEKKCSHWREEIASVHADSKRGRQLMGISRMEGCDRIACERQTVIAKYKDDPQVSPVLRAAITTIYGNDSWKNQLCEKN